MTYNGLNPKVRNTDALGRPFTLDAFGRNRVSSLTTVLAGKQVYLGDPLNFENAVTGTGAATYQSLNSATRLAVNANADTAIRQSVLRANYQPGKSQLIFVTYHLNDDAAEDPNVRSRVGYFDESNGIYFQCVGDPSSPTLSVVQRNDSLSGSAAETVVNQASWNVDTLDGSGDANNPSGKQLQVSFVSNIFYIAFEWLGVGQVECGWVIDGVMCPAHQFNFANATPPLFQFVYMRSPNLPVRWEIEATGAVSSPPAELTAICCSVNSEGGEDPVGNARSANTGFGATGQSIGANTRESLIGIRLRSGGVFKNALVELESINIVATGTATYLWEVHLNPTVTGQSFVDYSAADSPVQIDVSGTAVTASGKVLASGYGTGFFGGAVVAANRNLQSLLARLSTTVSGTPNALVLTAAPLTGTEEFYGGLNWFEFG